MYWPENVSTNAVVEIRARNWSAIWPFFVDMTFCRLLIFPDEKYSKFGKPKQILVGQMLMLVGKLPMPTVVSNTAYV